MRPDATPGGNETVLIVDDNENVRDVSAVIVGSLGHEVQTAEDATEALALIRSHCGIDLPVSDIVMSGGVNGFELARWARVLRPGLPVLLMSGYPAGSVGKCTLPDIAQALPSRTIGDAHPRRAWRSGCRRRLGSLASRNGPRLRRHGVFAGRAARGLRLLLSPHQAAERFPAARQARAYRADRHAENLRRVFVGHAFQTDQQDDLTLLVRKAGECAIELTQLPRGRGIRRGHERGRYLLDVDRRRFTRLPPHRIDILIVHDGEKPGADVGARLP